MSVRMNCNFVIQEFLVKSINIVGSDINLSIVLRWIKVFEFKKVNLNVVL